MDFYGQYTSTLKCIFYGWPCARQDIYCRIWDWIRNFSLVSQKWDPDPKELGSGPEHCTYSAINPNREQILNTGN
jgi:hypothetical protein